MFPSADRLHKSELRQMSSDTDDSDGLDMCVECRQWKDHCEDKSSDKTSRHNVKVLHLWLPKI